MYAQRHTVFDAPTEKKHQSEYIWASRSAKILLLVGIFGIAASSFAATPDSLDVNAFDPKKPAIAQAKGFNKKLKDKAPKYKRAHPNKNDQAKDQSVEKKQLTHDIKERKKAIQRAIATDPDSVADAALPQDVKDALPEEVKEDVETVTEISGLWLTGHTEPASNHPFEYKEKIQVVTNDYHHVLVYGKSLPVAASTTPVNVRGTKLESAIAVPSIGIQKTSSLGIGKQLAQYFLPKAHAQLSPNVSFCIDLPNPGCNQIITPSDIDSNVIRPALNKKILVLPIRYANDQTPLVTLLKHNLDLGDITQMMNNEFIPKLKAASFNKISVESTVHDWVRINRDSHIDCSNNDTADNLLAKTQDDVHDMVRDKKIDLTGITTVVYMIGNIECAEGTDLSFLGSSSLLNNDPAIMGEVNLIMRTPKNPLVNVFGTGDSLERILLHELGHSMGLNHGHVGCGTSDTDACSSEYGDWYDYMGNGTETNLLSFSAFHKSQLGWLTKGQEANAPGDYTLSAYEGSAGSSAGVVSVGNVGNGLLAQYFNNPNLTGEPVLTRQDPNIYHLWGSETSPDAKVAADNFSARWTGQLSVPTSGDYTLSTLSDDGVRVYVNNQLVIDNWTQHPATVNTAKALSLIAGVPYDIKVEYYEAYVFSNIDLRWSGPGITEQAIPSSAFVPKGGVTSQYLRVPVKMNGTKVLKALYLEYRAKRVNDAFPQGVQIREVQTPSAYGDGGPAAISTALLETSRFKYSQSADSTYAKVTKSDADMNGYTQPGLKFPGEKYKYVDPDDSTRTVCIELRDISDDAAKVYVNQGCSIGPPVVATFGNYTTDGKEKTVPATRLDRPYASCEDTVHHWFFTVDGGRVLKYDLDDQNKYKDDIADNVLGAPGIAYNESTTTTGTTTPSNTPGYVYGSTGPNAPTYEAPKVIDAKSFHSANTALRIACDSKNSRVFVSSSYISSNIAYYAIMVFDLSHGITNGMNASWILGQPSFTTYNRTPLTSGLPTANAFGVTLNMTYSPKNDYLYVADGNSYRIIVFDLSKGITNGMKASYVIGAKDLTSLGTNTEILQNPVLDEAGDRLFANSIGFSATTKTYDLKNLSTVIRAPLIGSVRTGNSYNNVASPLAYDKNRQQILVGTVPTSTPTSPCCSTLISNYSTIGASFTAYNTPALQATKLGYSIGVAAGFTYDADNQLLFETESGSKKRIDIYDLIPEHSKLSWSDAVTGR